LIAQTDHVHPLVRERATRSLGNLVAAPRNDVATALSRKLDDPSRSVRVAAAWALRDRVDLNSRAGRELAHSLDMNADQPAGQVQKGILQYSRQNLPAAIAHFQKAVSWDPNSAPIRHELAVVLSAAGRNREALEQLQAACQLAPREAEYAFKLALAWNELNNLAETIVALERAVALDPQHARAWYNLGLARSAQNHPADALNALARGEAAAPADARIPYARATILARLGRMDDARSAARRALELEPGLAAAREFLNQTAPGR
jgi:tetratricopeptide (TPR) repeat protein